MMYTRTLGTTNERLTTVGVRFKSADDQIQYAAPVAVLMIPFTSQKERSFMPAFITRIAEHTRFRDDRFTPNPLAENNRVKVMVVCFEPGQFIPVHRPEVDLTLTVVEGTGTVVAGDEEHEVRPGTVVFAPAGAPRGIRATTRLVALSVVTPPPTDADHAQVRAGLKARPEPS